MSLTVTHTTVATLPDEVGAEINKAEWNAAHSVSGTIAYTDVTGLGTLATQSGTFSGTSSGTNTGDQTTVSGNAGTATTLQTGRTISISGDLTYTSPSFDGSANVTAAGTLATVNSNVGTFGSATKASVVTVTAKGLVTAASETTVTPAVGSITGLGTNVGTFLATPSSANLAAALTDETGTGAAVFASTPSLTTPVIGGTTFAGATNTTASVIERISDIGETTVGSFWTYDGTTRKPINGRVTLYTLGAASGAINNSETIVAQIQLPAAFLHQYDRFRIFVGMSKSGTTDTGTLGVRIGTAGTTSDTQVFSGAIMGTTILSLGAWLHFKIQTATAVRKEGFGGTGQLSEGGGSTAAYTSAVTISNVSNSLYISVSILSSGATNTVKLEDCMIEYIPLN